MRILTNHNIIVQYNYQHRLHHINAIIHVSIQYKIIKETQICANTMATPQIYHATSARTQHDARIVHHRQREHKVFPVKVTFNSNTTHHRLVSHTYVFSLPFTLIVQTM